MSGMEHRSISDDLIRRKGEQRNDDERDAGEKGECQLHREAFSPAGAIDQQQLPVALLVLGVHLHSFMLLQAHPVGPPQARRRVVPRHLGLRVGGHAVGAGDGDSLVHAAVVVMTRVEEADVFLLLLGPAPGGGRLLIGQGNAGGALVGRLAERDVRGALEGGRRAE